MTQKTFRGRTLEEARKAADKELGNDYVIVATRKLSKPALFGLISSEEFEVTVTEKTKPEPKPAVEHPFSAMVRLTGQKQVDDVESIRTDVRNEVRTLRALFARNHNEDRAGLEPVAREIEAELGELHEMLLDLQSDRDREAPAQLKRVLSAAGIEGAAARIIGKQVRERGDDNSALESFRAVICDVVRTGAFPLSSRGRTMIALVGPTGVGKTTTAAKLAAHAILDQKRSVTLISTDSFRVGAIEQLDRFAMILNCDFVAVKSRHGLEEAIGMAKTDVVIVDTAGRPDGRDDIEASLPRLSSKSEFASRHTLLCVPAALREVDARRIARLFSPCHATSIAVTKLDETVAPSGLVHAPVAAKLPVSTMCFGQRVPEDISPAHPKAILDALTASTRRAPGSRSVPS